MSIFSLVQHPDLSSLFGFTVDSFFKNNKPEQGDQLSLRNGQYVSLLIVTFTCAEIDGDDDGYDDDGDDDDDDDETATTMRMMNFDYQRKKN